ncbi:MAG: flgI [Phycisphaerales bacterium]|nr:flgI [Phycisphaerales bacterium]
MKLSFSRVITGVVLSIAAGCGPTKPIDPPKPMYSDLGPKEVPDFLKNTVWQQTDLANSSPLRVSGFGLVVNLDGTGDTRAPNPVREYMIKQMQKHGFGSSMAGLRTLGPEQVLNDSGKRTAIVRVDGYIPPGSHQGQSFDVQVSALENSNTTSLHHGELYETDLAPRGADPFNPGGGLINPMARVQSGPIAINPAYALDDSSPTRNQKLSMRYGVVMNRGIIADERPIVLKLRQPERRLARQIEARLNERFQDSADDRYAAVSGSRGSKTAVAKDEGEVWIYVPHTYGADWERFVGVAMHVYFNGNADYSSLQAQRLADKAEAEGDKAPLLDISYCWEALGQPAIPAVSKLYASTNQQVSYAAARAGAYLGDVAAQETLGRIARTPNHPFQIDAVDVLAALPSTAQLRLTIRGLLDSDQLLVRIAAYKAMLSSEDPIIVSKEIGAKKLAPLPSGTPSDLAPPPPRGRFILDMIESDGPPVIYATRVGEPRIALIGHRAKIVSPGLLMAMNNRLTIMTDQERRGVQIFYRGDRYSEGASALCQEDLGVVIARLGGETPEISDRMPFQYTDVVGILQKLTDMKMIAATLPGGVRVPALFQIQSVPGLDDEIMAAPSIPDQRPQDVPATQKVTSTATP